MDHAVSLLTSFPPGGDPIISNQQYDLLIKSYVTALGRLAGSGRSAILANPAQVLQVLDPAANSIGYLFVLDVLLSVSDSDRQIKRGELLDKTLDFILKFDPQQIRYAGSTLLTLLERVGSGRLFSPLVAVELLSAAILRLDPSGSLFTSTHLLLAKLAFDTNSTEPALAVIDRDVAFYPNMAGPTDLRPLCDQQLEPADYISTATNLTGPIKSTSILEYNLLCGLVYISRRDWHKAVRALERVITHPTKDKGVSKIMSESYKKWLLVGLLQQGEAPTLPSYTAAPSKDSYKALAPQYLSLAALFITTNASQLKAEVESNSLVWAEDGNMSLVTEVVSAYQKWQIINLRRIYQHVPLATVQSSTLSADTAEPLKDIDAVAGLIRDMIGSGMLKGGLEDGADGKSYLTFQDDHALMTESDFAREIALSHYNITGLSKQYKLTNERLSGSKEYLKYVAREQKRAEKDEAEGRAPFTSQVEDEDLMTGVMTHS